MFEVPQVKLRVTKSIFRSMGAQIYNDLPIGNRQTDSFVIFKDPLRKYLTFD